MKLKHPLLFATAALLFFSSMMPILIDFYGLVRHLCFYIICYYLGAMIRAGRLVPDRQTNLWIAGFSVLAILYNSILTIPMSSEAWLLVDLLTVVFMLSASFLSPEAISNQESKHSN